MAKIQRATQQIFAQNAGSQMVTAFGTAMTDNPTYTTDVATIQNANFRAGWASAIQADKAPYEEDTNGLFYTITKQLAYLFQQGIPEYDASTEYNSTSIVQAIENGQLILKRSLIDNNIGNPLTDTNSWVDFFSNAIVHPIGDPVITLGTTLPENHIWLEGAEVSRTTYANLFAVYGTTYGIGNGSTTFNLPDARNRAIWGANTFGYLSAGLPNITGEADVNRAGKWGVSGAFYSGAYAGVDASPTYADYSENLGFDASRSSSIYGASTTVQPPAIKVRVYTRYQ